MKLDNSTIEQARNTDILAFFEQHCGFTFAHRGGAYRCRQHPSLAVRDNRLSWYWHSKGVGGFGALDYLIKVENMPFRDAVGVLAPISATGSPPPPRPQPRATAPTKTLMLPEKAGLPLRLFDYLCVKRGIDAAIVNKLIQKEMLYEDRRGNVVFVGYDELGKARFASLRGTYGDCQFRGDCPGSDKRYSFNVTAAAPHHESKRLYIFESAIDLMSHASLVLLSGAAEAWQRDSRLSLAGTSDTALIFFLNKHLFIKELIFCLDNDPAGREAAVSMARKYADKGYHTRLELPSGKDYNEDLMQTKSKKARHAPER